MVAFNAGGLGTAFSDLGGVVSSIGAGVAAGASATTARYQAISAGLQGQATQLQAQGQEEADRYAAAGDLLSAQTFTQAAGLEGQAASTVAGEIPVQQGVTDIQRYQTQRGLYLTEGAQSAAVAASGFGKGGSEYYLHQNSAEQGALALGLVTQQGALNVEALKQQQLAFETQQATDTGLASVANEAAQGADAAEKNVEAQAVTAQQQTNAAIAADLAQAKADKKTGLFDFAAGGLKAVAGLAALVSL